MSEQLAKRPSKRHPASSRYSRKAVPRSAEVQTVFVPAAALLALMFTGNEIWHQLGPTLSATLGHLHEFSVIPTDMQRQFLDAVPSSSNAFGRCCWRQRWEGCLPADLSRFDCFSATMD
jgi:hypothetical protein